MKKDTILRDHYNTVAYTRDHLNLLNQKRKRSIELLEMFAKEGLNPYIYGSIARGDVHRDSDIDLIFLQLMPPYQIEIILDKYCIDNYFREIIMATPSDTLKMYIHLNELESITIPLSKFDKKSEEFYDFGGKVNLNQLNNNLRVPGINKRLVLIKPTLEGHEEYSIIGNEHLAAKQVNVSIDLINERKRVLLKREKHGRTGVFLKRLLDLNESTEVVLKKLANEKSFVRKKLFQK